MVHNYLIFLALWECLFVAVNFACRIKSTWFQIQFEELAPKFKGQQRYVKEDDLKKAMQQSKKSIHLVTSYINKCIRNLYNSRI